MPRDPLTGRYDQVSKTVRGSKRDATDAAAALLTEVRRGSTPTKGTFGDLLTAYIDHARARGLAPKTLHGYELLARQASTDLGRLSLRKLTAARLDRYFVTLSLRGLSGTTIQHHHAFFRSALRQAVRWGWIDRSPADNASPPRAETPEPSAPSPEGVRRLLECAEQENVDLASLIWVAATTGMRRGELCGLRWADVNLLDGTLTVRRSITDLPGRVEARPTKTRRVRRVAIDAATAAVLGAQRSRAEQRCREVAARFSDDAFVWSQEADHSAPWRPDRVTHSFERVRTLAGLPTVRFHHLRHFAATMMLSSGVDVRTAAGRLGHAAPSMTLQIYAHALEQRDREAADLLGRMLSPPAIEIPVALSQTASSRRRSVGVAK